MPPPTRPIRAQVLALVRSSPAYVRLHDKAGWIGIFGEQHVIEDPVGWIPVRSEEPGALATFWDAFIAPNDITFQIHEEWIDGFDVLRDVTIISTLPNGVQVRTPAHLLYQTTYEGSALKVRRMAAHWESRPVYLQLVRARWDHVRAATGQSAHMIRTLGPRRTLRFVATAGRVRWGRKRRALKAMTEQGVTDVTKLIAAGDSVTALGSLEGAPAAAIAWFAPGSRSLADLRIYANLA